MQAPIQYLGSKRKDIPYIHKWEPAEFNKVVDVYGGGGSVVLSYLDRGVELIYNDADVQMCELFNVLKDEKRANELLAWLEKQELNEDGFKDRCTAFIEGRKRADWELTPYGARSVCGVWKLCRYLADPFARVFRIFKLRSRLLCLLFCLLYSLPLALAFALGA